MGVVAFDVGVILLADFVERAFPEVEGISQHVGFAAEGQLLFLVPLAGELEGVAQATFDAAARIDALLQGNLVRRAFEDESADAGVQSLVVLAHDYEVNMLGLLVFERAEAFVVKPDRAQVDILLQLEAGAEQDALFEDARLHVGMADGAEEDGRELPQLRQHAVGQGLAGAQIARAAQVIIGVVELELEFLSGDLKDFDRLTDHFRAGAVATNNCNVVTLHV